MTPDLERCVENYIYYRMPQDITDLIARLNWDLHNGPLYQDTEGEDCSMFDEGAGPFDFPAACKKVSQYLDEKVPTLYFIPWVPEVTTSHEDEEAQEIDPDLIRQIILGKELAATI